MSDATLTARLRSDPHDPLAMRALVRAGKAPPIWRLLASLGHERYQGLGLREMGNPWPSALLHLGQMRWLSLSWEALDEAQRFGMSLGLALDRRNRRAAAYILGEAP